MTGTTTSTLLAALWATWPAATMTQAGNFILRTSIGGGKRVSAASLSGARVAEGNVDGAEAAMRAAGRHPLFVVTPGQDTLDADLANRGYDKVDPTVFYSAPVAQLANTVTPRLSTYDIWPPLRIMVDLWAKGGVGPDRVAVMARAAGPKTAIFARDRDQPAGVGFVAAHDRVAMLHALEIAPDHRRRGLGKVLIAHAASWARSQGCTDLALAVTEANHGARCLYDQLGMTQHAGYHYRLGPDARW
ncbi:N-acetyltransferase [Pseudoruegeria sp. SK021]|uniref:GNAT family N-acetyltransferase n=1 Tax=Pseudoruegeria sp. SK021 TaxID=1933035 RepID=UPI000A23ECE7|nr:GNAT family N-acetyltransferase [Pseudoruegeria sp. SK021]OSP54655.1 hypothetical protein BV911_11705 [Pseudoruegeria sp. SK021]